MPTFSSKELELGSRVLGVDEASRVNLDFLHIDAVGTNLHQHLLPVTSGVGTVSAGQAESLGAVLLQKRGVAEVGSIATSSQYDNTVSRNGLPVMFIGDTSDQVSLLVDARNASLLHDLNTVRFEATELFQSLHEGVGNGHSGELGVMTAVCSGLRVTTVVRLAAARSTEY